MKLNTVVFDLDGTLVDTAPDLMHATNAILTAHGRRTVSLDELREMVGHGARMLIDKGFRLTGDPIEGERLESLYQDFVDHYSANIAVDSTDDLCERIVGRVISSACEAYGRPFIEIYEDAGRDFYEIPIELHSPAEVHLNKIASGRTFSAGRIDHDVLETSFYG